MDFAEKAARTASDTTTDDLDTLRQHRVCDVEILHVILAAARCLLSTILDARAQPDSQYRASIQPGPQQHLTMGRPIENGAQPVGMPRHRRVADSPRG